MAAATALASRTARSSIAGVQAVPRCPSRSSRHLVPAHSPASPHSLGLAMATAPCLFPVASTAGVTVAMATSGAANTTSARRFPRGRLVVRRGNTRRRRLAHAGSGDGYCALLTTGGVDCWGYGGDGELGNGVFYTSGNLGSAVPVAVVSSSGAGTLAGVASLAQGVAMATAPCSQPVVSIARGYGGDGELGNGVFYMLGNLGSAVPVAVVSSSGAGTLAGVMSLAEDGNGYCAMLMTGESTAGAMTPTANSGTVSTAAPRCPSQWSRHPVPEPSPMSPCSRRTAVATAPFYDRRSRLLGR